MSALSLALRCCSVQHPRPPHELSLSAAALLRCRVLPAAASLTCDSWEAARCASAKLVGMLLPMPPPGLKPPEALPLLPMPLLPMPPYCPPLPLLKPPLPL